MPSNPFKFKEGEKLLCYHGPLLYEAKCVKLKRENGVPMYFVHYQGWNKNWDEWVNDTRILKNDKDNLEKKEKLMKEHIAAQRENKKKGGGSKLGNPLGGPPLPIKDSKSSKSTGGSNSANTSRASTPVSERSFKATPAPGSGGTKRSLADDEISTSSREDDSLPPSTRRSAGSKRTRLSDTIADDSEPAFKFRIDIPEELKYVLASDWELVTHKKSLFNLPAKSTVSTIVNDYLKQNSDNNSGPASEVMLGITDLFDATLSQILLYKFERPQFREKVTDAEVVSPSEVYGSAHLLRLMTKIGPLLNRSTFDTNTEANVSLVEGILADFLTFLESNRTKYFTSKNYTEATDEYLKSVSND